MSCEINGTVLPFCNGSIWKYSRSVSWFIYMVLFHLVQSILSFCCPYSFWDCCLYNLGIANMLWWKWHANLQTTPRTHSIDTLVLKPYQCKVVGYELNNLLCSIPFQSAANQLPTSCLILDCVQCYWLYC